MMKEQMKKVVAIALCGMFVVQPAMMGQAYAADLGETSAPMNAEINDSATVRFWVGSVTVTQETVAIGGKVTQVPTEYGDGNEVHHWLDKTGNFVDPANVVITGDYDFYGYIAPTLCTWEHNSYVSGDGKGAFLPDRSLTRAQAAQMLFQLLESKEKGAFLASFSDVSTSAWYGPAVMILASHKVLSGTGDGGFHPDAEMTRAEFVAMLSRFSTTKGEKHDFTDVGADFWAKPYIDTAVTNGWVKGYQDGSFLPNKALTRAEAVVILNRLLHRAADQAVLQAHETRIFADLEPSHWAFADIMEASIGHSFELEGAASETWSEYEIPGCGLAPGLHIIQNALYEVDATTQQFKPFTKGFHQIDGKLYYAAVEGQALAKYTPGAIEIAGALYCAQEDGSFLQNGAWGYLWFDENGKYTTQNTTLDALVEAELAKCVNDSMSKDEKLRAVFNHVRDNFDYLAREHNARGSTDWAENFAVQMLETRKGNCYSWASTLLYMVRRIGYDAYPVSGGVGTNNKDHAWVMVTLEDGKSYIFDAELEWSYKSKYSFYQMTLNTVPFPYVFPN